MIEDYKDENLWLMKGDCLERMKEIPDGSVDVVISDIPYGIDYSDWDVTHNNRNSALLGKSPAQDKSNLFKTRGKPKNGWSENDKKRSAEFQKFCNLWLGELHRVTKPCSPLLIMTGRQNQHRFTVAAEDLGFIFKDYIIWDKKRAPFRAQNINRVLCSRGIPEIDGEYRLGCMAPVAEPIVWMFKPYKLGSTITDIFLQTGVGCFESSQLKTNIISLDSFVVDKKHETQKPVELMDALVKTFSVEGHTVLDMFMGSGTTGVSCHNLNRKFIGIEMDDNYFDVAKNRILGK
ncbi:DNA (cytosine-5-)-methyltransferase [Aeromonas phage 4L372XY]|uniref:DNA (Cytosine-5-)-methyltransferase n=1 Tax=Aeromonas phage 4L372XY TaxID=2588520 RepID=A0A5B9N4J6_9CAUD|nr:DNA methyltransferase [Aeromonas phage 4L372XY]QEG08844.1 DNA (cytosine-5-)-methyltransferase [Aeromonas phage 4L372XY]